MSSEAYFMDIPILNDIVIIFGMAILILLVCSRLRLPAIVGFLLTGMLVGPHGLRLVSAIHDVNILAEIGVVLLLFTIGIEFSLKDLLRIKRSIFIGGSLQVLLTLLAAFIIARQLGQEFGQSVFIGFLASLSSTVIVLKVLQERYETDSPHGRVALAILIFQDVIVVPMILFTPLLAGEAGSLGKSLLILGAKGVIIILLVIMSAVWIVPKVLYQIARIQSRELFLLSVVTICFAVTWLTSSVGLSLALGAFLAGLIVSESEYSHQALGNILPFRDLFASFFFVSVGMLLDVRFLFQQPGVVAMATLGVLVLKTIIVAIVTVLLGFSLRTAVLGGLALNQVGEFSFILSKTGVEYGLLVGEIYHVFLAVSVLTMGATPFMIAVAPRLADLALQLPLPRRLKLGVYPTKTGNADRKDRLKNHLVIIGFGVNGRNVARAARVAGIPHRIIEMNPEIVRTERAKGEPIYYGDATQETVLEHAGIKEARVVVLAISDPVATRRVTAISRRLNPKVHIIARTRYIQEMGPLHALGADEVIPEEFETSVEIFSRVLVKYLIPKDEIEKFIAEVRADSYEMFRNLSKASTSLSDLKFHSSDVEISTFRIYERSPVVGKSLAQIELRKKYGVTLLAIRQGSKILSNLDGDTTIFANDVLVVLGPPDKIAGIVGLLHDSEREGGDP